MENKLYNKIKELIAKDLSIEFWNGHQIKRSVVNKQSYNRYTFKVDKIKYILELSVDCRCEHVNNFVPKLTDIQLVDIRGGGMVYKNERIAEFLNLSYDQVKELYKPMIEACVYTQQEIQQSKDDYIEFVKSFKENFCL